MRVLLMLVAAAALLVPSGAVQAQEEMIIYGLGFARSDGSFTDIRQPAIAGTGPCGPLIPVEGPTQGQVHLVEDPSQPLPRSVRIPAAGEVVGGVTAGLSGWNQNGRSALLFPGGAQIAVRTAYMIDISGSVGQRIDIGGGQTVIDWDADGNGLNYNTLTLDGRQCCTSTTGTLCSLLPGPEYPVIGPPSSINIRRTDGPRWIFDGDPANDPSLAFSLEPYEVPGQVYGLCPDNITVCDREGPGLGDGVPTLCPGEQNIGDLCEFRDFGYRFLDQDVFAPLGNPDPAECNHVTVALTGTPNTNCSIPTRFAEDGDTLAGCFLANFGIGTRPDATCDGVDDVIPDKCPDLVEDDPFADANGDGIGDECQCGDGNSDGAVTGLDIGAAAVCANNAGPCDFTILDADGDLATTSLDIGGIVAVVNGATTPADLTCARNP